MPHFLISIPERFNLAIWARVIQAAIPGSVGSSGTSACIWENKTLILGLRGVKPVPGVLQNAKA